eukprot:TRINITY_DN9280_c0_g1_i7.p1 TRINITY_DN9280_c0_g1~~TRINITY_DN9280_c0_g1_i7.p1  ORF type:complete len:147 (+),score=3.73 TRINITY_DN9280_c0_g1_i7:701-1141(+)
MLLHVYLTLCSWAVMPANHQSPCIFITRVAAITFMLHSDKLAHAWETTVLQSYPDLCTAYLHRRVGVTPTPKFKSRLQPAKKGFFLPPIQTHSIASSKASSALTSPLISHRTSRAQSGFSGRQAPLPPSASSRASSIPKSATIHSC